MLLVSRVLSSLFTLFCIFAEIVAKVDQVADSTFCRYFLVPFLGLSHLLYLLNLLLTLIHYYVNNNRSTFTTKIVTIPVIIILNVSLVLIANWVYIVGFASRTCSYHKLHLATLIVLLLVLFIPCVVFSFLLHLRNERKRRREKIAAARKIEARKLLSTHRQPTRGVLMSQPSIVDHSATGLIERQEMQVKITFLTGVPWTLFLYCPLLLLFFIHSLCLPFVDVDDEQEKCNSFMWLAAYLDKLISMYVLVDSLAYLNGMDQAKRWFRYHRAIVDYRQSVYQETTL